MSARVISSQQQFAARLAGFLYLFLMVCGVVGEFVARGNLIVDGDMAKTIGHIAASPHLFRLGILCDLTAFAGDVAMAVALYVLLSPIGKYLALTCAFWRVAEAAVLGAITLNSMTMLLLLAPRYGHSFSPGQVQSLVELFNDSHDAGYTIGMLFLALGCMGFSFLLFRSRYVPRWLALCGLISYVAMLAGCLITMVFPDAPIGLGFYMPAGIYEIVIGLWLLIRGVR
jgi:Domain of unknown function (DUF4386)